MIAESVLLRSDFFSYEIRFITDLTHDNDYHATVEMLWPLERDIFQAPKGIWGAVEWKFDNA